MEGLNQYFRQYHGYNSKNIKGKILHFTSQQMCNFSNLIRFHQREPDFSVNSRHTAADQFEEMYHNLQLLKDLKVTFTGDFVAELTHFQSLENIHLFGPCLRFIRGLRSISSKLKSLIVVNGDVTLSELLSLCCLDESRPMSWPCLLSLKVTNCGISSLDASLKLLPNVQEVDLSFNRLALIRDEFSFLNQLTYLNLGFNRLKRFPQFSDGIQWKLQYLYLMYNELSSLDGIQVLESILEFDISHNLFLNHDALQPLRYLTKLQKLNLLGNPIYFNKQHRALTLHYISPQAVCPKFILDGASLTEHDLKDAMYTPTAVSNHSVEWSIRGDASINNVEPDSYDVSMSYAADVHWGVEFDLKLCSHHLKKENASRRRVKIECTEESVQSF